MRVTRGWISRQSRLTAQRPTGKPGVAQCIKCLLAGILCAIAVTELDWRDVCHLAGIEFFQMYASVM
ncbi:hypothetical protein CEY04_08760 [Achromobacter sp. HZ28]|nr:hypothetical protein CEY05_18840 [Achromobacter sp. HZ34]OWT79112.1 hypothetical protein CEY04_08760 [Achromobacter sp. HZ28]